jgi:ATP synthase protein I
VPDVALGPRRGKQLSASWRLASVGIEFAISVVIGLLGGQWLDGRFGTEPYLMIVGLLFGVTAGFRGLIRAARTAQRAASSNPTAPPDARDE